MLRIAIVEDSSEDRADLVQLLRLYEKEKGIKIKFDSFPDGEDFLEDYQPVYDIVFMDIEMPGQNGIDIALRLRQIDKSVCLIFVTNMAQFAIDGYKVNAVDFLLKPLQYFYFAATLDKAVWNNSLRKDRFVGVETSDGVVKLAVADIIYIDSDKHYVTFHTTKGDYRSRGTINTVQAQLPPETIARCHASILVNLDYVIRIRQNAVDVKNGSLPISRTYKKAFWDVFTAYLGGVH